MSAPKVYQIAEFDNEHYYFDIVDNEGCSKSWKTIMAENKAIGIINLGYFGLAAPHGCASGCKIHGEWKCKQQYTAYGVCIDKDGKAFLGTGEEENAYSYAEALPIFMKNGVACNRDQTWSKNGTTTLGFKNGNLVCMICDKDNGQSSAQQIAAMEEYGCTDILRMDGSWSSQGRLGFGKNVQPSQMRYDRCYMLIYEKEEKTPMSAKKVTIDPYSCTDAVKYADTFDFCDEVKYALETYEGIECMLSCYRDNANLDVSLKAKQSNEWGADLVVCLSANASGSVDGITAAWTNKTTSSAYKFALSILDLMKENGLNVPNIPTTLAIDPMLAETNACAAMAAFIGDLSTKAKRHKAVCIITEAVCNKLGVTYNALPEVEKPDEPTTDPEKPENPVKPEEPVDSFEGDPYNEYDEEAREEFTNMKKLGIIPEDVNMGEVIRYGDLVTILAKVVDNMSEEDEDDEENVNDLPEEPVTPIKPEEPGGISIDEEALKTLIINTMNEVLNDAGITESAIAEKVSTAVENYMNEYDFDNKTASVIKTCFEAVVKALDNIETGNM